MQFKLNFKPKLNDISKYFFVALVITNLVAAYFLMKFLDDNLTKTLNFYPDEKQIITTDIDLDKFDRILKELEKKNQGNQISNLNNIFK